MKLKLGFIIDPLSTLKEKMDTTLLMVSEANVRGHEVYYCTLDDLELIDSTAKARLTSINYVAGKTLLSNCSGQTLYKPLSELDVVIMRKDPPFDKTYLAVTYILDYAGTVVINNPRGLREANEKLFSLRFKGLMPQTLISRNAKEIESFINEHGGDWVSKPLDLCGGQKVFHLRKNDLNLLPMIKNSTANSTEYTVIQSFIDDVYKGDKRIFLVNGEPIGKMNRIPPKDDFRANIHLGASPERCELTTRDYEIVKTLKPTLEELQLNHVCLDIIGNYLTEVNVTSPSGIPEINQVTGKNHETYLVDSIEKAGGKF